MVTDEMVRRAATEYLSHRGERPYRVTRRGAELWEDHAPAMRAALEDALSAAEPVAWRIVGKFDSGSTTWKVVQHEHQAHEEAKSWEKMCAVEVHPLYAAPPAPSVAVKELPYHCDVCTVPGYGDAPCSPLCDRSALSAQVQDVAETEVIAALKKAEPYVEICHSLMTQKETRADVWRVLKQVRAAIAAAPAKQEGGESKPVHNQSVENGESGDK